MKTLVEICILAGGLSSRMGRNKSQLQLNGKTLLGQIRRTAKTLRIPVRTIRRDLVPRCGPMGGVYTALKTTSATAVLFLACDMPQVSTALLIKLLEQFRPKDGAIFTWSESIAGFPFLLSQSALPIIQRLLLDETYSLQDLAKKTRGKKFRIPNSLESELMNINTPEDWNEFKTQLKNA